MVLAQLTTAGTVCPQTPARGKMVFKLFHALENSYDGLQKTKNSQLRPLLFLMLLVIIFSQNRIQLDQAFKGTLVTGNSSAQHFAGFIPK